MKVALLSAPYTQEDRNNFGYLLADIQAYQILDSGLLHADPHPGNFAFRKDGRMIIYDFGCVHRIPHDIQEACLDFCRIGMEMRYDRIDEVMLRLGIRNPGKENPGVEFYREFADVMRKPFLPGRPLKWQGTGTICVPGWKSLRETH